MGNFIAFIAVIGVIYYGYQLLNHRHRHSNQADRKKMRIGLIICALVLAVSMGIDNKSSFKNDEKVSSPKVVKKVKYVGKDKYDIAKKENLALVAKKQKLEAQKDSLDDQKDDLDTQERNIKAQQEQAAKEQQEAADKAQKEAEENQKQQAQQQASEDSQPEQSRGDMNTSDTGQIVGNSNSHIYHVPGQRGYNMNSANAVYFNSEQEAINAGYRKAKV